MAGRVPATRAASGAGRLTLVRPGFSQSGDEHSSVLSRKGSVRAEDVPTHIKPSRKLPHIVETNELKSVRFPLLKVAQRFGTNYCRDVLLRLTGRFDEQEAAVRVRKIFEDLGGLWIKVGQLIAMRNDIYSDAVCLELTRLQSSTVGFPLEQVRASIRADLGAEIEDIFDHFDQQPFAAASISQVHFARLAGKPETVCVKVLRPDAERTFMRDIKAIDRAFKLMNFFGFGRHFFLEDALYELDIMVQEELDFRYEASNMRRMRKTLKRHSIHVPRVHRKHSGRHVLVTDYVDGQLMADFIDLGRTDPKAQKRWCAENNVNLRKVATKLFLSALRQLFEDNLFHADIHPGNIILLRDSRVCLIDFGTIGTSSKSFLINYRSSLAALASKDFDKAADVTMQMTISPPSIDHIAPLRKQLVRLYREWDSRSSLDGEDYHDRSMANAGSASGKVMAKFGVQLTWEFMKISRTWATLDASISHLYPDADYMELFRKYFSGSTRRARKLENIVPRTARIANSVASSMVEYEAIIGPAIRKKAIYSSAAGHTSERIAMSLVAFLKMVKWLLYVALVGGLLVFLDTFIALESKFEHRIAYLIEEHGYITIGLVILFIPIMIRFLRQAINNLSPRD